MIPRVILFFVLVTGVRLESTTDVNSQNFMLTAKLLTYRIDNALTIIELSIENFKNNTWNTVDSYRNISRDAINELRSYIDFSSNKLESELSRFVGRNVSEFTCNLIGQFRNRSLNVFDSVRSCVNETIDEGIRRVRNISNAATKIRLSLLQDRKDIINCVNNTSNISSAVQCVTKISSGIKVVIQTVPGILIDFAEVTVLVSTFRGKMKYCASLGPTSLIQDYYSNVISKFSECVGNKLTKESIKTEDYNLQDFSDEFDFINKNRFTEEDLSDINKALGF